MQESVLYCTGTLIILVSALILPCLNSALRKRSLVILFPLENVFDGEYILVRQKVTGRA